MNMKQTLKSACSAVVLTLATSSGAVASDVATNKVFVSAPLILVFLGFCALVVVLQCIPAIIALCGMIKGAVGNRERAGEGAR